MRVVRRAGNVVSGTCNPQDPLGLEQGVLQRNPELQVSATASASIRTHPQMLAGGAGPNTREVVVSVGRMEGFHGDQAPGACPLATPPATTLLSQEG